jgi:ABC-type dipeptide/oligopeptide/nickel transport system permease subunit
LTDELQRELEGRTHSGSPADNLRSDLQGKAPMGSPEVAVLAAEGGDVLISSGWRLAVREFAENKIALVGVGIIVFFFLFCFLGPLVDPTNQTLTQPLNASLRPGAASPLGGHAGILGTDENGFDELGRIMLGGQTALEIGFFAAFISIVIGTLYGAVAGLSGRLIDGAMMRFVDVLLSIPFYLIVLILATKFNATVFKLSLLLGIFSWLVPSRLMRGEVLTLRERDFVWAARTMGSSRTRLVYQHLIPNALSVVIVNVTFLVADSILYLAYLGFLGFGLQYPNVSWGDMLGKADTYISNGQWWLVYPVGLCLVAVVMAWNLVGDALRDARDVRLQRR